MIVLNAIAACIFLWMIAYAIIARSYVLSVLFAALAMINLTAIILQWNM